MAAEVRDDVTLGIYVDDPAQAPLGRHAASRFNA